MYNRYGDIPEELTKDAKFCCWRYENIGRDKPGKVPYNPLTGGRAQSNNEHTFCDYKSALAKVDKYDGLGIGVFRGVSAIDIDHCVDEGGNISVFAKDVIEGMDSYTEISPSGTGIRILFKVTGFRFDKAQYYINKSAIGMEVYVSGATHKYVTVTGRVVRQRGLNERVTQLQQVLDTYMKRSDSNVARSNYAARSYLSDETVMEKALNAKNSEAFSRLWKGDIPVNSTHSEADMGLASMLAFWCGGDIEQMDRLFRNSGLMRDKWDRHLNGSTYGRLTLEKAAASVSKIYDPVKHFQMHTRDAKTEFEEQEKTLADLSPNNNERYGWNDIGNGNLFADWYKDTARYIPERKLWFIYDGKVWRADNGNLKVMELCKKLADVLMIYALSITDEQSRQVYINFVKKWQGRNYRETILKDAAGVYPVSMSEFDKDPYLFNCTNGTLNLSNKEFRAHSPADMLSKMSGAKYDPNIKSERWEEFISQVMQSDTDKAQFLQKAMGYTLTGDTRYECFFILYGNTSRNGKGTCMETFMQLMGDYGKTTRPESIGVKQNNNGSGPSEEIARLAGTRFVNVPEPDKKLVLSAALVKTLTGNDTINARFLHENSYDFKGQFKLFINTNYLPTCTDVTLFSSGRVKLIPFERHFQEHEQDKGLKAALTQSANISGILNWCLEGLARIKEDGFGMPESVRKATDEYKMSSDKIGQFVEEEMEQDLKSEVKTGDAYNRYQRWCTANGLHAENSKNFKTALGTIATITKKRPQYGGGPTQLIIGYKLRCEFVEIEDPDCPFGS